MLYVAHFYALSLSCVALLPRPYYPYFYLSLIQWRPLFQPVNHYIEEEEAALQVVVVLRARLLPPLKSAPARALVVNEQNAKRRSRIRLRQSLSPITKPSLARIRSLHQGRLLRKPELRSTASGTGVAIRLHRRGRPI